MTKYYIKAPGESQFTGPSFPDEIRKQLETGGLRPDALALEATGQSSSQLKQATGWFPVSTLLDALATGLSPAAHAGIASGFPALLARRYADAYTEAHAVVTVGKLVKSVAVFLFVAIVIAGFVMASASGTPNYGRSGMNGIVAGIGFALACLISIPTYVLGILVAAQGQTALATLDTAVNSSRHLKEDDVARVLSKRFSL